MYQNTRHFPQISLSKGKGIQCAPGILGIPKITLSFQEPNNFSLFQRFSPSFPEVNWSEREGEGIFL